MRADVAVLGSGVAGLSTALTLARAGCRVTLLTKGELAASATRWAQGGVAAAMADPDSADLHFSDTISAGGGLCDAEAVRVLCAEGPDRLRGLMAAGASFDLDPATGAPALAREGGHSLARVLHAGGDATGWEIERALIAAATGLCSDRREHWLGTGLLVEGGRCVGVAGLDAAGAPDEVRADHVVLASGGAGHLFAVTTNPPLSTGDGVAMALAAGAAVADIEFMQFHPTALHHPATPKPLLSEALRGEGARLRDERGLAFMADEHPQADLAPRDVVARAITRRLVDRGLEHLWLDATGLDGFAARFPTIWRNCRAVGLDPGRDWLPVAPAAHYLCGGIVTDLDGAASLPGLWACGEVSCTGVHGANRLASNSLLEGLVFGHRAALAILEGRSGPCPTGAMRGVDLGAAPGPALSAIVTTAGSSATGPSPAELRGRLQRMMTAQAGVLRDATGLDEALIELDKIEAETPAAGGREVEELRNLVVVGRALVLAAAERDESRGAHHRLDFPDRSPAAERVVHLGTQARQRVAAAVAGADR